MTKGEDERASVCAALKNHLKAMHPLRHVSNNHFAIVVAALLIKKAKEFNCISNPSKYNSEVFNDTAALISIVENFEEDTDAWERAKQYIAVLDEAFTIMAAMDEGVKAEWNTYIYKMTPSEEREKYVFGFALLYKSQ